MYRSLLETLIQASDISAPVKQFLITPINRGVPHFSHGPWCNLTRARPDLSVRYQKNLKKQEKLKASGPVLLLFEVQSGDGKLKDACAHLAAELIEQVRVLRQANAISTSPEGATSFVCAGYVLPKRFASSAFSFCKVTVHWDNQNMRFVVECEPMRLEVNPDAQLIGKLTFEKIVRDSIQQITDQIALWDKVDDSLENIQASQYVCRLTTEELTHGPIQGATEQVASLEGMVLRSEEWFWKLSNGQHTPSAAIGIVQSLPQDNNFVVVSKDKKKLAGGRLVWQFPAHTSLKRQHFMSDTSMIWGAVAALRELHNINVAHLDVRFANMVRREGDKAILLIDLDRCRGGDFDLPAIGSYVPSIWYANSTTDMDQFTISATWRASQLDWFQLGVEILNVRTNNATVTVQAVRAMVDKYKDDATKLFVKTLLDGKDPTDAFDSKPQLDFTLKVAVELPAEPAATECHAIHSEYADNGNLQDASHS
eukprot:c13078_g1_i3.p1 GENE.c13078_g1_i3~~c13078_g1_i3.p1  ORF type:complete len:482 (+),score=130.64 c13078_g1_i3:430-1875(+)